MAFSQDKLLMLSLLVVGITGGVLARGAVYTTPKVERLTDLFSHVSVTQGFSQSFGGSNIHLINNGTNVDLVLDKSSGSGLVSKNKYYYGFFSAAIKLPAGFTSGVVVAFYLSNADLFPHNHDEIDFELLGHEKRRDWVLQTNIYGNGSVNVGREEKFYLWFDPTEQFHEYSILWNNHHTVFLVDNVPVREVIHNGAISSVYPSKAMSAYATIWDASQWATHGGKYPVNYKYAPFIASIKDIEMEGCIMHPMDSAPPCSKKAISSLDPLEGEEFVKLSQQQIVGLDWARRKHMFYSYCKDTSRYKVLPPECNAK
ncbi:hypothetical protein RJ640_016164 [Escallonia rubra]|uniref:Xyloglucan endotransglucosylase/hydrolase n=1 Tax=Escallonia rubra TaxID=112253 RepID=A0AA88RWA3_9ASTE|nr:hypothetical protein RJ640_016164 [Escallonia rubra]